MKKWLESLFRGLARSDAAAASVSAAGAEVHRGSLEDLESLRRGAVAADGLIHTGLSTTSRTSRLPKKRRRAIGDALASSERPLIVTSGTLLLQRPGPLATEQDASGGTPSSIGASTTQFQLHHHSLTSDGNHWVQRGDGTGSSTLLRRYLLAARRHFRTDVLAVLLTCQK